MIDRMQEACQIAADVIRQGVSPRAPRVAGELKGEAEHLYTAMLIREEDADKSFDSYMAEYLLPGAQSIVRGVARFLPEGDLDFVLPPPNLHPVPEEALTAVAWSRDEGVITRLTTWTEPRGRLMKLDIYTARRLDNAA